MREEKMKRRKRNIWKRCLAVIAMAVTLLGGLNYSGLEDVLAEEKSGYKIDVSFSEENNQVTLTGNTESMAAGITLVTLKDQDGKEHTPDGFQTTVEENGTYKYVLTYNETAEQTGTQLEKTEELTVTVNQIKSPEIKTSSGLAAQGAKASSKTAEVAEPEQTLPIDVLETSLQTMSAEERATASASIDVYQYAYESNTTLINNNPVSFTGGVLSENAPAWTPTSTGVTRSFVSGGYVTVGINEESPYLIDGLYPVENDNGQYDWYYTLPESGGSTDYGNIAVGYLLPDSGVQVRFYYRLDSQRHAVTVGSNFSSLGFTYTLTAATTGTVTPGGAGDAGMVMAGDTVTMEVELPSSYRAAVITVAGRTYGLVRTADASAGIVTADEICLPPDEAKAAFVFDFTMPHEAVNITLKPVGWSAGDTRSFAIYLPEVTRERQSSNVEFGTTRLFTISATGSNGKIVNSDKPVYTGHIDGSTGGVGKYKTKSVGEGFALNGQTDNDRDPTTGGGAPYMHSELWDWRYSTKQDIGRQSGDPTRSNLYVQDRNVYLDVNGSQVSVPTGHFYPGGAVNLRLETSKAGKNTGGTLLFEYTPGSLYVDVYEGDGNISDATFTRYIINLSELKTDNASETVELGEGSVTVRCVAANRANYVSDVDRAQFYGYGLSGGGTFASHSAWAYDIKMEGLTRPFKVVYNALSSQQQNNGIASMSGVVEGRTTGATSSSAGITGSYIHLNSGYQALQKGLSFIGRTKVNGVWELGILPEEGYGFPTVSWINNNQGTVQFTGRTDAGRYIFNVNNSQGNSTTLHQLDITAPALKFRTEYRYNDVRYEHTDNDTILSYDSNVGQRSFRIAADAIPDVENMFLQGFQISVYNGNKLLVTLVPSSGSGIYWQPGDTINVEDIYERLRDQGQLQAGVSEYTIELEAQMSNAVDTEWTRAQYTLYNQKSYFDGEGVGNDYTQTYFDGTRVNFNAKRNEWVYLTGFKDQYEDNASGKKYVLDPERGTRRGQATNNANVGNIYYLSAATVNIEIPTDLDSILQERDKTLINSWNTTNSSTYYTGSSSAGTSTVATLPTLSNPTNGSKVFAGWKIVSSGSNTTTDQYVLYDYEISNNSLDLNAMGKAGGDGLNAWNATFGESGNSTITLIPYYVDGTKPIQASSSGTQTVKFYKSPHEFSVDFIMEGKVTASSTAQFLAYRSENDGKGWGLLAGGTIDLSTPSVTKVIGNHHFGHFVDANLGVTTSYNEQANQTTITFKASDFTEGGPGRQYRIYMWNEANPGGSFNPIISNGGAINSDYKDYINKDISSAPFASFPYADTQTYLIPEVYTQLTTQTTNRDEDQLFYEGEDLDITATFSLQSPTGNLAGPETIDTMLNEPKVAGELHIALYKKNPPTASEKRYQLFALATTDGAGSLATSDQQGSIGSVTIQPVPNSSRDFTVMITKTSGSHTWDDGAEYRVYAWTGSNTLPETLPNFGTSTGNYFTDKQIASVNTIPSVETTTTAILNLENGIIQFPRAVTMSDDGDQHIYSGNEQITLEPIPTGAELPNPDPGVDVTIEQLTNWPTFNISRSNNDTIVLQAFTGTRTSGGTDISASGGKVGTMKFSTGAQPMQNTLPLYFKSKDTVTGFADGDPFRGHITFRFSKAASN